ncbi:TTC21B [Symbiodinium sp. KB8]|nr:TTC21B [Symbiodinium sp. KB8]
MAADIKALIYQYARQGFYRNIQTVCGEVIRKRGSTPALQYWQAFGLFKEGELAPSKAIKSKRAVAYAAVWTLKFFHEHSTLPDMDAVAELELALADAREAATPGALHLAAMGALMLGEVSTAQDAIEAALAAQSGNAEFLSALGWVQLTAAAAESRSSDSLQSAAETFMQALSLGEEGKQDITSLLGMAKVQELGGNYDAAYEQLNEVIVTYPWFRPAQTLKAQLQAKQGEWEQSMEIVHKILQCDAYDIECLRLDVLHELAQRARPDVAATRLEELVESLDKHEPHNPELYLDIASCTARVAGGSRVVLQHTVALAERARALDDVSAAAAAETAWQYARLGEFTKAFELYRIAGKLDETSADAISGTIYCQLHTGAVEDAGAQLELFHMVQETIGRTAELAILDALLAWRSAKDVEGHLRALDEARALHRAAVLASKDAADATVFSLLKALNPEFVLEMTREYLVHAEANSVLESGVAGGGTKAGSGATQAVAAAVGLLRQVTTAVPGLMEAHTLLARTSYAGGELDDAARTLVAALALDPTHAPAHMLMASVSLAKGDSRAAAASLREALSNDFSVRKTSATYHLIDARVAAAEGRPKEAIAALRTALDMPGVRQLTAQGAAGADSGTGDGEAAAAGGAGMGGGRVSLHDRANIFVQLATLLAAEGQADEATAVAADAAVEFAGTPEEVKIVVAHATLALEAGDISTAITLLGNVPYDSPAFAYAQRVKANIYLRHRRNKLKYIQAFRDMVEHDGSDANYLALGQAYMRIGLPEEALGAFQAALDRAPDDAGLASTVGKAMVTMHDYRRAVEYYEHALETAKEKRFTMEGTGAGQLVVTLRSDLTTLFIKLGQFERAGELIAEANSEAEAEGGRDVITLQHIRANLRLLARMHTDRGDLSAAIKVLTSTLETQSKIISQLRQEAPELLAAQRDEAAEICHQLAEAYEAVVPPDDDKAKEYYAEALNARPNYERSMLALARLHLRRGELDESQRIAEETRRVSPGNQEAIVMLADLLFSKEEADAAMFHFSELLEAHPRQYEALAKLITLLKRSGRLEEAPRFLKQAVRSSAAAEHDPGYKYCQGLYCKFNNEPHSAIQYLNAIRHTGEYGVRATEAMVEIYISPDGDDLWHITLPAPGSAGAGSAAASKPSGAPSHAETSAVAERLLAGIPPKQRSLKHEVLGAYVRIARRTPEALDEAVSLLTGILDKDPNYAPALLAMATALMINGETPKARNQLKRIVKLPYNSDQWAEFVKAWLMLADIYIASSKFDHANAWCRRALKYDASCARAWEYLGMIAERESAYRDAADMYKQAWKHDNEASAPVGYKLAFNYLKADNFVRAIDVCHKVLEIFPDYDAIRTEVLHKARALLRP